MKFTWLGCLLYGSLLLAGTQESEINVNTRYTVETVVVSGNGWTTDVVSDRDQRISTSLRREIMALVGHKLNPSVIDDLAKRLRHEFHARAVTHRVQRGGVPDYVKVIFELKFRPAKFDLSVPKFLYANTQGWSGLIEGTGTARQHGLSFGLVSDGDEQIERYAGLRARYENTRLGDERVRFRFQFESYHSQWNRRTLEEIGSAPTGEAGIYRARQNFEPVVTFAIAKPLTLSVGASFERLQTQFPAAHNEAANAVITTLRYHRRLEGSVVQQDVDAGYNLRAATRILSTDFVYARHNWHFRYSVNHGKHTVLDDLSAGLITGQAPLFERYVGGNSAILRGWNKWDLDPIGGNRMVHNSVEYRYGVFQVFYDSGSVWDRGQTATVRHSIGVGLRQSLFSIALAFPIREGRIEPIVMVGMNY
jgi:hypothetical protein